MKIQSAHFEVFTTAGEKSGREAARHFEQVRGFFVELMGAGVASGAPVRIVVFKSEKEFRPYAPNQADEAFYLGAQDRDYIVMKNLSSDNYRVAVHEYVHLLVKHSGRALPIWLNEGLAEFYSTLEQVGNKIEVGDAILGHYRALQQSKWIDLKTLLSVTHDSPLYNEKNRAGVFYAESWALAHMLYIDAKYRPHVKEMLAGIYAGMDGEAAFRKAYGKSLAEVEKDLRSHMSSPPKALFFDAKLEKSTDEATATPSSDLEGRLVMAEIMANAFGRAEQARTLYERLAADYPKDWRVEEGFGKLCWRDKHADEAIRHFAKAAELGSTDAKMYLLYGQMLRVDGKRGEAAAALARAVELDPESRDARLELAFLYLTGGRFQEALEQLHAIRKVTPEQAYEYFHALAYAQYRTGQVAQARSSVETCRKYAKTPGQIDTIDDLGRALDESERPRVAAAVGAAPRAENPEALRPLQTRPAWPVAEGTLKQIDCQGRKIRMRIDAEGKSMVFAILDPNAIAMKSGNGAPVDFTCGPQKSKRIRIEYDPKTDVPGAAGVVRTIEFP